MTKGIPQPSGIRRAAVPATSKSASSRPRIVVFWATTVVIAAELGVGGVWDILRVPYVREVLEQQLGYPAYVAVIIGIWKVPGALVLLVPRLPRLKEWVYAGAIFTYTGAAASHLAIGAGVDAIGPIGFAVITMISWKLRPTARMLPTSGSFRPARQEPGSAVSGQAAVVEPEVGPAGQKDASR